MLPGYDEHILHDESHLFSEPVRIESAQIFSIHTDGPFQRIVKPLEKADDRCFSGPRGPDNRQCFTGIHFEGKISDHGPARLIRELDIGEFDGSKRCARNYDCFRSREVVPGFEETEYSFRRRHGGLHDGILLR